MKKSALRITSILLCVVMLCTAFGGAASAEDAAGAAYVENNDVFRASCTIKGDAQTQRGFCWYTKEQCDTKIQICEGGQDVTASLTLNDVVSEDWEGYCMHKVTVSGLKPGTTYTYALAGANGFAKDGTFTTDNGDSKVNFIAIADVQAGNYSSFAKGQRTALKALEVMPDADFVANLGDFTNDSDNDEWNCYAATFDTVNTQTSLVPVSGNHDGFSVWHWFENMFNVDTSESVQNLNGVNYSYEVGNVHFAVLNTNDMISVSLSQLKWLYNDLNSTNCDWKIVFMHKAPYTLGKDGKWPDALYLQKSLIPVLQACDVDLVMYGHDHQYLRTKSLKNNKVVEDGEGITYVLSGTAGSKRYEVREFMLNKFITLDKLAALNIQKDGMNDAGIYHQRYLKDGTLDNVDLNRVGGVFNTVSVDGGTLSFKAYVLKDKETEDEEDVLTEIDSFELTKETGKNKATFTGDNTTSFAEYLLGVIPSFIALAIYTLGNWLPRFFAMLPSLAYVYATKGIF